MSYKFFPVFNNIEYNQIYDYSSTIATDQSFYSLIDGIIEKSFGGYYTYYDITYDTDKILLNKTNNIPKLHQINLNLFMHMGQFKPVDAIINSDPINPATQSDVTEYDVNIQSQSLSPGIGKTLSIFNADTSNIDIQFLYSPNLTLIANENNQQYLILSNLYENSSQLIEVSSGGCLEIYDITYPDITAISLIDRFTSGQTIYLDETNNYLCVAIKPDTTTPSNITDQIKFISYNDKTIYDGTFSNIEELSDIFGNFLHVVDSSTTFDVTANTATVGYHVFSKYLLADTSIESTEDSLYRKKHIRFINNTPNLATYIQIYNFENQKILDTSTSNQKNVFNTNTDITTLINYGINFIKIYADLVVGRTYNFDFTLELHDAYINKCWTYDITSRILQLFDEEEDGETPYDPNLDMIMFGGLVSNNNIDEILFGGLISPIIDENVIFGGLTSSSESNEEVVFGGLI